MPLYTVADIIFNLFRAWPPDTNDKQELRGSQHLTSFCFPFYFSLHELIIYSTVHLSQSSNRYTQLKWKSRIWFCSLLSQMKACQNNDTASIIQWNFEPCIELTRKYLNVMETVTPINMGSVSKHDGNHAMSRLNEFSWSNLRSRSCRIFPTQYLEQYKQ